MGGPNLLSDAVTLMFLCAAVSCAASAATAGPTREDLAARGFKTLVCTFTERCRLGMRCEPDNAIIAWHYNDDTGEAYRDLGPDHLTPGILLKDQDRTSSMARAIVMPMRQGAAGHFTNFYSGGAIYSMQYEGNTASGDFLRGTCDENTLPVS